MTVCGWYFKGSDINHFSDSGCGQTVRADSAGRRAASSTGCCADAAFCPVLQAGNRTPQAQSVAVAAWQKLLLLSSIRPSSPLVAVSRRAGPVACVPVSFLPFVAPCLSALRAAQNAATPVPTAGLASPGPKRLRPEAAACFASARSFGRWLRPLGGWARGGGGNGPTSQILFAMFNLMSSCPPPPNHELLHWPFEFPCLRISPTNQPGVQAAGSTRDPAGSRARSLAWLLQRVSARDNCNCAFQTVLLFRRTKPPTPLITGAAPPRPLTAGAARLHYSICCRLHRTCVRVPQSAVSSPPPGLPEIPAPPPC
jgi:hypothetical protein